MEQLIGFCKENGIQLDDKAVDRLEKYMKLVIDWNEKINLTSITERDEFIVKHFCDSLSLLGKIDFRQGAKVIDIGTGAGFPAIPLKIARPDLNVTMLDSLNKRMVFIREQVLPEIGLEAEVIHGRAEELSKEKPYREGYDICVSRAVANLSALCEYCIPFVKVGGVFAAMKGFDCEEEITSAENAITTLGGELGDAIRFKLPDESGRCIVVIDKVSQTPSKYPRRGVKISKNPL